MALTLNGVTNKKSSSILIYSNKSEVICTENVGINLIVQLWKELSKCLDDVFVQMFGRKITTSTLSSCTCSSEGQATLNEYVRCGLYSKK